MKDWTRQRDRRRFHGADRTIYPPNPAAAENGRKLAKGGKFSVRRKSADGTLYWAECAGSGKNPYHTSIDWTVSDAPVCRCSCPSRQFPCKHALGLMFEMLSGRPFEEAEIPRDILDKRAKQAARAAKKESAPSNKPKKPNGAAQAKKLNLQLEGLDRAEKMVNDLLSAGVDTLAGSSAQTYEKLAKDLGGYYLTGPQTAFARIALAVRAIQNDPGQSERAYAEALRILIALRSTIKKSRVFLQQKLEAGQYSPEDSALFEALAACGGWRTSTPSAPSRKMPVWSSCPSMCPTTRLSGSTWNGASGWTWTAARSARP